MNNKVYTGIEVEVKFFDEEAVIVASGTDFTPEEPSGGNNSTDIL